MLPAMLNKVVASFVTFQYLFFPCQLEFLYVTYGENWENCGLRDILVCHILLPKATTIKVKNMTYNNESLNLFFFSHYHSKMCVIRGSSPQHSIGFKGSYSKCYDFWDSYSEDLAYLIFNFIWLAFQN